MHRCTPAQLFEQTAADESEMLIRTATARQEMLRQSAATEYPSQSAYSGTVAMVPADIAEIAARFNLTLPHPLHHE